MPDNLGSFLDQYGKGSGTGDSGDSNTPSSSGLGSFLDTYGKEEMTPPPTTDSLGSKAWEGAKSVFGTVMEPLEWGINKAQRGIEWGAGQGARGLAATEEALANAAWDTKYALGGDMTPEQQKAQEEVRTSIDRLRKSGEQLVAGQDGHAVAGKVMGEAAKGHFSRILENDPMLAMAAQSDPRVAAGVKVLQEYGPSLGAVAGEQLGNIVADPTNIIAIGQLAKIPGLAAKGPKLAQAIHALFMIRMGQGSVEGFEEAKKEFALNGMSPKFVELIGNTVAMGTMAGLGARGALHENMQARAERKKSWDVEFPDEAPKLEEDFSKATDLTDIGQYLIGDEMQPPPTGHPDIDYVRQDLEAQRLREQDKDLYGQHRAIAERELRERSRQVEDEQRRLQMAESEIATMREERAKRKQQEIDDMHQRAGIVPQDRLGKGDWKANDAMRIDKPPDLEAPGTEGPLLDDVSANEPHPLQEPDPLGHLVDDLMEDMPEQPQQPPQPPPPDQMQPPPTQEQPPPQPPQPPQPPAPEPPAQPPQPQGEMTPPPTQGARSAGEADLGVKINNILDKEGLKKGTPEREARAKELVLQLTGRKRIGKRGQRLADIAKAEIKGIEFAHGIEAPESIAAMKEPPGKERAAKEAANLPIEERYKDAPLTPEEEARVKEAQQLTADFEHAEKQRTQRIDLDVLKDPENVRTPANLSEADAAALQETLQQPVVQKVHRVLARLVPALTRSVKGTNWHAHKAITNSPRLGITKNLMGWTDWSPGGVRYNPLFVAKHLIDTAGLRGAEAVDAFKSALADIIVHETTHNRTGVDHMPGDAEKGGGQFGLLNRAEQRRSRETKRLLDALLGGTKDDLTYGDVAELARLHDAMVEGPEGKSSIEGIVDNTPWWEKLVAGAEVKGEKAGEVTSQHGKPQKFSENGEPIIDESREVSKADWWPVDTPLDKDSQWHQYEDPLNRTKEVRGRTYRKVWSVGDRPEEGRSLIAGAGIESQNARKAKQAAALERIRAARGEMAKEALPPTTYTPDMINQPPPPRGEGPMSKVEREAREARRAKLQQDLINAQTPEVAAAIQEHGVNQEMLSERARNYQAKQDRLARRDEDPFAVLSEAEKARKKTQKMLEMKEKAKTAKDTGVVGAPQSMKPRLAPKAAKPPKPVKGTNQATIDHVEVIKSRLMDVRNDLTYMHQNPKEFSKGDFTDKMQQVQQLEAELRDAQRTVYGKETGALTLDPKAIGDALKAFNASKAGQSIQGAQGVYQASLAGGIRTAVRNVLAAAGEGTVMNLADVVNAAQYKLRGQGERAGEHWAKVEQRMKNMKTAGLLRNLAEAAPALLGEGKAAKWLDKKVEGIKGQKEHRAQLEALETTAKGFTPTELHERWRHLVGSEVQVTRGKTRPLKVSEKVGRFLMLANELQERSMRLGIMKTELAPYMKKHGVKDYKGLFEKAMKDDVAAVDIGNVVSQAMTASLQRTKGLGPKGKMGKAWTDAFNATPGSKFVQPFTNFLFNNFIPNMLETNPITANITPKSRTSRMREHQGNIDSLKKAIPSAKKAVAEYNKFVSDTEAAMKAAPVGQKQQVMQAAKGQMDSLRQAKIDAQKEVTKLRGLISEEQKGGVYSQSYRASLAAMGPMVIGMSALLRAARGEDGLDATQLPAGEDDKGNKLTRQIGPLLTAYAPYVVIGDMLAREAMGSKYYANRLGKKLGESFTGGQSGRPGLADIYSAYAESDEKGAEVVRKVMADIGQGASKLGWINDVAQMFREAHGGEQPYRRPDLTEATGEGVLKGGAKAFARGVVTPWAPETQQKAYDPSSGEPRMAPTVLDTIFHGGAAKKRLSPLTAFLQSHPDMDVKGALMKQAGSVKWDEKRYEVLREKLEEDVIPIINDPELDDKTKEDAVASKMRKILTFSTEEAQRQLAPEDIPQKEVEKEQKAMEKEERRRQTPGLFGRQPGYRGLRKGERSRYRDSLSDRMSPPPTEP